MRNLLMVSPSQQPRGAALPLHPRPSLHLWSLACSTPFQPQSTTIFRRLCWEEEESWKWVRKIRFPGDLRKRAFFQLRKSLYVQRELAPDFVWYCLALYRYPGPKPMRKMPTPQAKSGALLKHVRFQN